MKKTFLNKVLAGVMALCLAGTYGNIIDTAVFAADDSIPALTMENPESAERIEFIGISASLEGIIAMNFFTMLPENLVKSDTAEVHFQHSGKLDVVSVKEGEYDPMHDWYKFTCYISAKEMNDDITMSVYDGDVKQLLGGINGIGFVNNEFTYTAGTYFSGLKEMQSDPKLISLADAILDYGYFAQQLFNYNTGWLEEQTLNEDVSAEELQNYKIEYNNLPEGVTLQMSLLLKSETSIRLYFSGDCDKLGSSLVVDGKEQELKKAGNNMKYVEISNIAAGNLDKVYTVAVNENCEIKVSALSYAYAVLNSDKTDEANKTAMKALYLYSKAADAYLMKEEDKTPESSEEPEQDSENDSTSNPKLKISIKIDGKIKF